MSPRWAQACMFLLLGLCACSTTDSPYGYSTRVLTIASLDMFSQKELPRSGKSWVGDWQFRRDRLELIDATLRDQRPDIFVMQNAMRRAGSVSESDQLILKSGALSRYDWRDTVIETMAESGEERLLAIAAARPLKIMDPPVDVKNHSQFGVDGHISIHPVQDEEGVILVVNVLMPSQRDESGIWYSLLEDKIRDAIRVFKACIERVIVAGYLPFEQESRRFKDFLLSLGFKDTGSGLCQSAERCQTASPENGIFLVTRGDESPAQLDRIMTHRFANILSAGANFTRILETTDYKDNYGLSRVWASQRYGWVARARLPICPSK